jgi:hypothetical protein
MESVPRLVFASARQWAGLVRSGNIWRAPDRLGQDYRIDRGGTYRIFRETHGRDAVMESSGVLVVGFRLRIIGSNRICHWLFQRLCLLTTPFWSGFPGFRIKLWMVDPETKNYLGIYEWAGEDHARTYVETLMKILRPLSTPGSVWYERYPGQALGPFLNARLA